MPYEEVKAGLDLLFASFLICRVDLNLLEVAEQIFDRLGVVAVGSSDHIRDS